MNQEPSTMSDDENATRPKRRAAHLFQPGNAGGPGRPKKIWTAQELMDKKIKQDLKAAAKEYTAEAFNYMLSVLRNDDANTKDRMAAAGFIVDRGWGKPTTQTEVKVDIYNSMSDAELIKLITGKEVDASLLEARDSMLIEHEPQSMDDDASEEGDEQ